MSPLIDDVVMENNNLIILMIKISKTDQTGIRTNVYIHRSDEYNTCIPTCKDASDVLPNMNKN